MSPNTTANPSQMLLVVECRIRDAVQARGGLGSGRT
jgi:hypothetical protein